MTFSDMSRPARRLASGLAAAALRILFVFAVLLLVTDGATRLAVQLAPAAWWFEVSRVVILPGGSVTMVFRRSYSGDLPVSSIVELHGPDGEQPCASSGRRVIERDTTYAVAPVHRLLPDCRWRELPDGDYRLSVTVTYAVGGTVPKDITAASVNAIVVRGGRVVGATAVLG